MSKDFVFDDRAKMKYLKVISGITSEGALGTKTEENLKNSVAWGILFIEQSAISSAWILEALDVRFHLCAHTANGQHEKKRTVFAHIARKIERELKFKVEVLDEDGEVLPYFGLEISEVHLWGEKMDFLSTLWKTIALNERDKIFCL